MKIALTLALAMTAGATSLVLASPQAQPQSNNVCLQVTKINNTIVVSDREILFRMIDGKYWKNTLRAECHGLKFERGFKWTVHGGTVCSNSQVITVLGQGNPCWLGEFTAYTPDPAGE